MIISELTHCQAVAASSEILGAGGKKYTVIKNKVTQKVDAYAVAINFGKKGSAEAYNYTEQYVSISN